MPCRAGFRPRSHCATRRAASSPTMTTFASILIRSSRSDRNARALIPYLADAVPGWFQATLALRDAKGRELAYDDDFRFNPDPVLAFRSERPRPDSLSRRCRAGLVSGHARIARREGPRARLR